MSEPTKTFITNLAKEGGKLAYKRLYKKKIISYKKQKEIVTEVDKIVEKFLIKKIHQKFPSHEILGEETGKSKEKSKNIWILDPIDGTANFAKGYPKFSTVVTYVKNKIPQLCAVYDPNLDHLFFSQKNKGMYFNGKKQHVSKINKIKESMYEISESAKKPKDLKLITKLIRRAGKIRCTGSTALSLAYVACGWIDARVKPTIGKFDVIGGALMINEANGKVTDFKGNPWQVGKTMLATNKILHNDYLKIL